MKTNTFLRAVVAAVAVMVMAFSPVAAVTDGYVDEDNVYSYVGIMVAQNADGTPLWRCSGTLISSYVFLTAGHCTEAPATNVEIWFDVNIEDNMDVNGYPFTGQVSGVPYTHPEYDPNAFYLYDVGVVVLDNPIEVGGLGALPQLDQLDSMATRRGRQDVSFTAVGYGLQTSYPSQAAMDSSDLRIRMISYPNLVQINTGFTGTQSLLLSNNANTGGTCFGDSGGPNFIGSTNVIGGVTSFGVNGNCAGTGGVYRIDRADDLTWIQYVVDNYLEFQRD